MRHRFYKQQLQERVRPEHDHPHAPAVAAQQLQPQPQILQAPRQQSSATNDGGAALLAMLGGGGAAAATAPMPPMFSAGAPGNAPKSPRKGAQATELHSHTTGKPAGKGSNVRRGGGKGRY